MAGVYEAHVADILADIAGRGLLKRERQLSSAQGAHITVGGRDMINLCSNNYLGLADHPEIVSAATQAMRDFGFGMASVRFICGTTDLHRALEHAIARYLQKDDAILFAACFDANGGLFETLMAAEDAIISDSLNHASIIDGIRLSRARRYRFVQGDMQSLEVQLKKASREGARFKLIVTDGVFSMDGHVAPLETICDLAERHDALVAVDDCHATGHLGPQGRGTPALTGVGDRVHIVTGTFGKTLGGAMGGFITASQNVIDLLRQRARPYLFSNSLAPAIASGALRAIAIAKEADDRRAALMRNSARFRNGLMAAGFDLLSGDTPIIPVMLGDAHKAQALAQALDERGVYVTGFVYPVVPEGKARIRTQMSSALSDADVDVAIAAFRDAGERLAIL